MPNPHPFLVHLPIALLTIGFLFDLLAVLRTNNEFERVGWWMQFTGTVGLALTIISGVLAGSTVTISEGAKGYFEIHEQIATLVAVLFSVLLLWRIAQKCRLPKNSRYLYLGLFAIGVIGLLAGAWFGGEMVYRFSVGVR
jgi:uncharacterized membrane protein